MAAGRVSVPRRRNQYVYSAKDCDDYRPGKGREHGIGHKRGNGVSQNGINSRVEERRQGEVWRVRELDFARRAKNGETRRYEDVVGLPPEKKRKFSPVIWDLEEKEVKIPSKNGTVPRTRVLSPSTSSSPSSLSSQILDPVSNHNAYVSAETSVSESQAISSLALPREQFGCDDKEEGQIEEGEFVEDQNVSMSRWASEIDNPRDGILSDDEQINGFEEVVDGGNSSESTHRMRSSSTSGQFQGDGSGDTGELSGSVGSGSAVGLVSRDGFSVNELANDDDMDVDRTRYEGSGPNQMELDDGDTALTAETEAPVQGRIDMLQACRSVFEYEKLNRINEGTYGVVYRARDKKTGQIVALKKVKMDVGKDKLEHGFPLSALREINILLSFCHPSIVSAKEVVMDGLDNVFMVMEYMEHDLKGLMEVMKQPFSTSEVKSLMLQLLEGVKYLHDNWVIHRDLKTSNILLNNQGELKLCDFGMSRQYGTPLEPYTSLVVTLTYRAPELLLGAKQYSTAVDMWSVGCIMAELLAKEPLFRGKTDIDQLKKIFSMLGTPNETIWPGFSELPGAKASFAMQPYNLLRKKFPATSFTGSPMLSDLGLDLLNKLLTYDPEKRITVDAALNHSWFREVPLPKSKEFMPTFPPLNVQNRQLLRAKMKPDGVLV